MSGSPKQLSNLQAEWFRDFVGVGYRYHDVYMNVFPLFQDKMFAFNLWKKTVGRWSDEKIKLRFIEQGDQYWFILYHGSEKKDNTTGFVKRAEISENYERFKAGYEKKAILRFGIYKENLKKKDGSKYDLEILKKEKSVHDIQFMSYSDLQPDSVESNCIRENY